MAKPKNILCNLVLMLPLLLTGCGGSGSESGGSNETTSEAGIAEIESDIRETLNNYDTELDFTFFVNTKNGRSFIHSTGASNEFVSYESASTSKLVSAAIILTFVDDGLLSLDDHPQDYISTWPTTGNLADIRLSHLLSFTSGLANDPLCLYGAFQNFENCVNEIAVQNSNSLPPGSEYYYSASHLQVAGLMAMQASGYSSWELLFTGFQGNTALFLNSTYDVPSKSNPRLAGGMHWTANDYMDFLDALYNNSILSSELFDALSSDQIGTSSIGYSPVREALNEDWHYGYGAWVECPENPYSCSEINRISSPGSFGAYPFIDLEQEYYGIVARQGDIGTSEEGIEIFRAVQSLTDDWASR